MAVTISGSGQIVKQIVQATTTTATNTTSTSFVDTGLSVSITPTSSSNKILVLVQGNIWMFTGSGGYNCFALTNICRGVTQVHTNYTGVDCQNSPNGPTAITPVLLNYLDSPSTTSPTTYKVQIRCGQSSYSNQITFNLNGGYNPVATITLMEIAYA